MWSICIAAEQEFFLMRFVIADADINKIIIAKILFVFRIDKQFDPFLLYVFFADLIDALFVMFEIFEWIEIALNATSHSDWHAMHITRWSGPWTVCINMGIDPDH